ncbi:MAG: hypothetical protein Q9188_001698 [Gyalolechia gomerana]
MSSRRVVGLKVNIVEGQNTYFHLNHPIRWIRLVGVIVALDVYPNRVAMTLDDSSGLTIDVFCRKEINTAPVTDTTVDRHGAIKLNSICDKENGGHVYTTNEGYKINLRGIDVGSVVKVKGGISEFRGEKQLTLERICVFAPDQSTVPYMLTFTLKARVHTTSDEARAWAENAAFYRDILSRPWIVSERKQQRAKVEAEGLAREWEARRNRKRRKKELEEKREHKAKMEEQRHLDKSRRDGKQKREAHQRERSIAPIAKQYRQS